MHNSRKSTAVILFLGLRTTQSHDQDQKSDSNIGTVFFRKIATVQGPNIFLRALTVSTTCSVLLSGQLDGLPPLLLRHGNVAHAALTRYVTLFTHSGVSQSHPQAHTRQPWRVTSSDPSWEAGERNALWDGAMGLNSPEPNLGPRTCTSWTTVPIRGDYFGDVSSWEGEVV